MKGVIVFELGELVGELRRELYRSMVSGKDEPMRLQLSEIQLEVTITAERQTGGNLKLWALAEVADQARRSNGQRLTLTLNPYFPESASKPWVSDTINRDDY